MKYIILSICIPTYNRAEYIGEAIESVLNQITDDIKDKVEICISDNASTDDTEDIVHNYQKKSKISIVYFKNEVNLGADRNFLKVIDIANGEYCWYLGSDDAIGDNAILYILKKINEKNHDFLLVGRDVYDSKLEKKISTDIKFEDLEVYDFKSSGDLTNKMFIYIGFLSAYIFKKSTWNEIINSDINYKNYFNSYIHVFLITRAMNDNKKICYVSKPLVKYRGGNDSFLNELGDIKRIELDIFGYLNIYNYLLDEVDLLNFKSQLFKYYIVNKLIDLKIKGVDISVVCEKLKKIYLDPYSLIVLLFLQKSNKVILSSLRKLKRILK